MRRRFIENRPSRIAVRPQLPKLMASLKQGDIVLMTKLDRLGRSTRELLELIERIGQGGRRFPIAQFERSLIAECTGDGRKRSIANRVKFGRKPELSGRKL